VPWLDTASSLSCHPVSSTSKRAYPAAVLLEVSGANNCRCAGRQGSVDFAVMRLDEYRQRLQSRVIERYDAAVASGNLATMAQCARIMSEFQRGQETCVQVTRHGPLRAAVNSQAAHKLSNLSTCLAALKPILTPTLPPFGVVLSSDEISPCQFSTRERLHLHRLACHVSSRGLCGTQRYISMRPMFIDLHEVLGQAQPATGAAGAAAQDTAAVAMQRLNGLYKDLLHAVKEEALLMEQIFPDPATALASFISRVFEQKIKARHCLSG